MSLPGGAADKRGNEYERPWTAKVMLELLAADSGVICVEALDEEWRKYEFYVERNGRREGHQVKRQHGFHGAWSTSDLRRNGVMEGVRELLTRKVDTDAHLISTIGFDQLGELTERARDASDESSFFEHYTKSKVANAAMQAFKESWGSPLSDGESFQMLRRIFLHSLSAADLKALVEAYAARWFSDPAGAVEALGVIAWENLGIRLGPVEIWAALRTRGIRVRPDRDRETVLSAIYGHTELYLAGSQRIPGVHLGRSDATRLADLLRAGSPEVWMVGVAGSGKSEIARELVNSLRDEWPTLAVRLDRMSATPDPRAVAAQCGLSGSVVQALVAAAQGGAALLVLDQLDALSIVSGRRQDLLDAVREIVRQARMTSGIRLVVVCRRFDLDHDDGLSQLRERGSHVHSHDVAGLPDDEVRDVVVRLGGIIERLTPAQIRLLQLPLHLALYAEVLRRDATFTSFVTASHLFDRFIHLKRELVLQRQPALDWHCSIKLILERMSEEQALWVSWKWLLARMPTATALVSENILVRSGDQVGFFHEVLFDHLFALHFDDDLPVAEWLKTGEQSLFRRSQVRQILAFRRDSAPSRYLRDLRLLLLTEGIRPHIQVLVLGLLGAQAAPTADEVSVFIACLAGTDLVQDHALQATRSSQAWFAVVRDRLPALLGRETGARRRRLLWWLVPMAQARPDDVAALLEPRLRDPSWVDDVAWFVSWSTGFTESDRFVQMTCFLIRAGHLDRSHGMVDLWHRLRRSDRGTSWGNVARLMAALLRRQLHVAGDGSLDGLDHDAPAAIRELADGAPDEFASHLLPVFYEAVRRAGARQDWRRDGLTGHHRGHVETAWTALFDAAVTAGVHHCRAGDRRVLDDLICEPSSTPQSCAARIFIELGPSVADDAIAWLLGDARRIGLTDGIYGRPIEDLLRAIGAGGSPDSWRRLELAILKHAPDHEKESDHVGFSRHRLMSALSRARLSPAAIRHAEDLAKRFEPVAPMSHDVMIWGDLDTTTSDDRFDGMDDDAWLSAMVGRSSESRGEADGQRRELVGELRRLVAADPSRFCALASMLPASSHPDYFAAVLSGVKAAGLPVDALESLVLQAHQVADRPLGREIVDLVEDNASLRWSDTVFDVVAWYAVEDPDPTAGREHVQFTRAGRRDGQLGQDVETQALNSVRGGAARCITMLIHAESTRIDVFRGALSSLVADPHPAVRAAAADSVRLVSFSDEDLAWELATRLFDQIDAAAAGHSTDMLLRRLTFLDASKVLPILERMVDSPVDDIAYAGAVRAAVTGLLHHGAAALAERVLHGSAVQRRGAAAVMAANFATPDHETHCLEHLPGYFSDVDVEVRKAAAGCFRPDRDDFDVGRYGALVEAFVDSPAFVDDHIGVVMALEKSRSDVGDLVLTAAARFLDNARAGASDVQQQAAFTSSQLRDLVLRTYAQAVDDGELKRRALDVIDDMYRVGVRDLTGSLEEYGAAAT